MIYVWQKIGGCAIFWLGALNVICKPDAVYKVLRPLQLTDAYTARFSFVVGLSGEDIYWESSSKSSM